MRESIRPRMATPPDLLDKIAASPPLAEKLAAACGGAAVAFEQVVESARPCLAAVLAPAAARRTWIVCANVREQELVHQELLN